MPSDLHKCDRCGWSGPDTIRHMSGLVCPACSEVVRPAVQRDAYQRGHRDALLALAADLDVVADGEREEAKGLRDKAGRPNASAAVGRLLSASRGRAAAYTASAHAARRLAESLPNDPEEIAAIKAERHRQPIGGYDADTAWVVRSPERVPDAD